MGREAPREDVHVSNFERLSPESDHGLSDIKQIYFQLTRLAQPIDAVQ
jgi:hypothetical protein